MRTSSLATLAFLSLALSACDSTEEKSPQQPTVEPAPDSGTPTDALCSRHPDDDGDGYGASAAVQVACDAPGFVDSGDDCNDTDPLAHPGASERCNGQDDDCDAVVDEDLVYDWYADLDADGYGAGDSIDDCDPAEGFVDNALDCDDNNPTISPDATERCNTLDDDCDSLVDDEDDSLDTTTTTTFYRDYDGDGSGDPTGPIQHCALPEGYAITMDDCDDTRDDVHPGATEVCNGLDDDCNEATDDADPGLDASTGTEWHPDLDADGFGDSDTSTWACLAPADHVEDNTDCDDTNEDIHPSAAEVCNEADDDCDGDIDDADADVDTSTGSPTYADLDGDGYGDVTTGQMACAAASGRTLDSTDCDDSDAAIHPAATEVCNDLDDDCDRDIDDDDSSLDLSTADTWYRDADGDGAGDPALSTLACDLPSGYADNPDDCDDSGFDDLDEDGLQDCEDTDADGDGLSETYDVDDLDDTLARGPQGGFGTDGALSSSGGTWSGSADVTHLTASGSTGDGTITVDDTTPFAVGDEVLVWNVQGTDAGVHAFHFIVGMGTGTLSVEPPLTADFDATDTVLVQRVPHYSTVAVTGALEPDAWDGASGGLVVFRATGAVSVSGSIDASGAGYVGGDGTLGHREDATGGGTHSGGPSAATLLGRAVDSGGGARLQSTDSRACGGGGGYGTAGEDGDAPFPAATPEGGDTAGSTDLATWFYGSGGGGGASDSELDGYDVRNVSGAGGAGGGLIAVYSADSIVVSGRLLANGDDGVDAVSGGSSASSRGEIGGGGGGAGGQILLVAPTLTVTGLVEAVGGAGGFSDSDEFPSTGVGGEGGDGRTRALYNSASGTTNISPSASTDAYVD